MWLQSWPKQGCRCGPSIDLETGWNLTQNETRARLRCELPRRRPRIVIRPPPCTNVSALQRLTPACRRKNYLRFCEELEEGRSLLELAMQVAKNQLAEGAGFLHEHPRTASIWQEPCVSDLATKPGIYCRTHPSMLIWDE